MSLIDTILLDVYEEWIIPVFWDLWNLN